MRIGVFGVVALGLLMAACGTDTQQRAATGGLAGLGVGALVGGPVGAALGAAAGAAGGWAMPEGADTLALNAVGAEHEVASGALNEAGLGPSSGDAASGSSTPPAAMSEGQIRSKLLSEGYDNISQLQRRPYATYTAQADRGNDSYRLRIDAQTGRVITQRRLAANQMAPGGGDNR